MQLSLYNDIIFLKSSFKNDFKISKFLEALGVTVNHLTLEYCTYSKENFIGLESLSYFTIIGNKLELSIDHDVLLKLPNLKSLHIEESSIDELPIDSFRYFTKLKILKFSFFRLKLIKEQFAALGNLEHLELDVLERLDIENGTFDDLTSLRSLDITIVFFDNLPEDLFKNLINLETVCVSMVDFELLDSLGNIFEFPNKLFANLKSLKTISLKFYNSMKLTSNTFGDNFGNLQNLSISGYRWQTLPAELFNKIPNVKILQLSHNRLSSLEPNIFLNLQKLEILDLSYNKFQILDL